ncbi:hypothetical protein ABI_32520 [Asticcacaulis biprosthecium C19]|uniref:Uncharacterized protein n=1 Tax=Asticcacaulis biprosthecium C19 TaxID=715226 RepID=F4QPU9_9CAUL|nr:hypothetical protein [Asticcacaulis biprosthecium]EGF90236.1 hypothetical protein ABI_32520 [Asticcacaulis biprosthecium C19]
MLRNLVKTASMAVSAAVLLSAAPAMAQNMISQTGKASEALPGLQKFLNLPAGERSQVNVYYNLRIKNCDTSKVTATLNAGGKTTPLRIAGDGRITPLPTRDQLNAGATITMNMPQTCTIGPKIKVHSTQAAGKSYDAAGLALGIKQGNAAMGKIAGAMALALKKLDRVYFVGGGDGTVEVGDQKKPMPKTAAGGEYPAGTPYFVPSQFPGATRITLTKAASTALFDTPPK